MPSSSLKTTSLEKIIAKHCINFLFFLNIDFGLLLILSDKTMVTDDEIEDIVGSLKRHLFILNL